MIVIRWLRSIAHMKISTRRCLLLATWSSSRDEMKMLCVSFWEENSLFARCSAPYEKSTSTWSCETSENLLRKISVRMIHMAVSYVEVEEGSNDGENVFNARTTTRVESFVDWHLMWKSVQGRFLLCLIWMRKMLKKMNDDSFGAVNSQISRVPKCARCEWESRATSWNQIDLAICVWKPHNNFVFYHFT